MKLTFFLIALALVLLRLCYPALELWHNGHGSGTMTMTGDHFTEQIKWSGKIRLSDDERSIAEISPGGYLKFRENDTTLKAESNLQGEISYSLYNGHEQLPLNDSGQQFIAVQIQKMIQFGFLAEGRALRIYRKGGVRGLLDELSRIKMEGAREPYLDLLLKSDSLSQTERIELLRQIDHSGNTMEQQHFLKLFTRGRLRDSAVAQQWLSTVGHMDPSYMKKDLLLSYLGADSVAGAGLPVDQFDTVLAIAARFGAPNDQQEVFERMTRFSGTTDAEWASLLRAIGKVDQDYIKSDLFLKIAQKMPRTDSLRAIYSRAARSIQSDNDYGKAMRALE